MIRGTTDDPRGACHWCAIECATSLYSVGSGDPDHEAVIRFGGKAPRRRVHSPSGIAAIAGFGLPPPRIVVDSPSCEQRGGCQNGYFSECAKPSLRRPAAARPLPVPPQL